ncbi:GNAT family N-acetyltransferase [Sphingopyxis bauzanensis]|uniref:GNAT family N-acetyltransferase n=1 Tax=Sphingopyxis bauzanensis TaxID=651663 RepID=UPI00130381DB|nr:GNAT family N-acetyltransferase [Sphingopyxis bauzanensis]
MASLAHEALAPYYNRLSIPEDRLRAILADEACDPATELGAGQAMMVNGRVAALIVGYPADEMRARQQASLFHLLRAEVEESEAILVAAGAQAADVTPIPSDAFYLARIAVTPVYRGTGLAETLLSSIGADQPLSMPIGLHVHRDNERAIRFYLRGGFVRADDADLPFRSFVLRR